METSKILPDLSRTFKSKLYHPKNNDRASDSKSDGRKRKRSDEKIYKNTTSSNYDGGSDATRCFEIRSVESKGIGIFATQNIKCGDFIIPHEDPIVHCRASSQDSSLGFCHECVAPIGSLRENHLMIPGKYDGSEEEERLFPYFEENQEGLVFTSSHSICQDCNRVVWCSDECRKKGKLMHSFLCGRESKMEAFYEKQENPMIFQLAVQAILLILSTYAALPENKRGGSTMEQFYWWKDYGSHPLWWEVGLSSLQPSAGMEKKQLTEEFLETLQSALFPDSVDTACSLKGIPEKLIQQLCTLENIGSILGMLQCNVMEFQYPSPLQQYMEHVEEFLHNSDDEEEANDSDNAEKETQDADENAHIAALKSGCRWLATYSTNRSTDTTQTNKNTNTHEETPSLLPVIGSGLYPLLTLANHDCNPNASIEVLQESCRASMVALRNIEIGEEICITYVPNGGVGGEDCGEYFRQFTPTRTWKWLHFNDNDGEEDSTASDERSECDNDDGEKCDGNKIGNDSSIGEDNDDEANSDNGDEEPMEGSDPKKRAEALLEYGFKCKGKRCFEETGDET